MSTPQSTLFVGLGSPHGDDRIGWLVADELARSENLPSHLGIRKAAIPLDLLDWLDCVHTLVICDAAETSAETGKLQHWEWNAGLPAPFPMLKRLKNRGSHDFDLAEVLDLAAKLNRLPARIVVWAISASQFGPGQPMSEELQRTVPFVSKKILAELSHA